MNIGEVIKKHRKKMDLTQEELANLLGVTAPAVNKWERGRSQPDISLLGPIARLFNINIDTLLSFEEDLGDEEVNRLLLKVQELIEEESYESALIWAKKKIEEYPSSSSLILQMALVLEAGLLMEDREGVEEFEGYIKKLYLRALSSQDEDIRARSADSLFNLHMRRGEYGEAEGYLDYLSNQNPEKKRKKGLIYSKTGRTKEAYRTYEELLFSYYNMISSLLLNIYRLAILDDNMEKAHKLAGKQKELAAFFEMGDYHAFSLEYDLSILEEDSEKTRELMEKMLDSLDTIFDFSSSDLYEDMEFKEAEEKLIELIRKELEDGLED